MEVVAAVVVLLALGVVLGARRWRSSAPVAPPQVQALDGRTPRRAPRPTRRLGAPGYDLGATLVEAGVVTEGERARAERVLARLERPRWLGDVLIELGYCVRAGIRQALEERGLALPPGEVLLEQGLVDEEQLRAAWAALGERAEDADALESWLEAAGHLSRADRLQALAARLGLPFVDPARAADRGVLGRLPARYLEAEGVVPLAQEDEAVRVAVSDPERFGLAGELEAALGARVRFALATPAWIASQLQARAGLEASAEGPAPSAEEQQEELEVASRCVDLVRHALERRATDLHLEPGDAGVAVRLRVDGVLAPGEVLPRTLGERLVRHLRVLASCGPRGHQRGRFSLDLGELELELRLSTYATIQGDAAVLRLVLPSRGRTLEELGLVSSTRARVEGLLRRSSGVVLFAGPSGAGCSTTLYAALDRVQGPGVKVVTAERAVDRVLEGVSQRRLDPGEAGDVAATLRALLSQDPDVIGFSEVEDRATAEACMQAALTGHTVVSTIHAEDSLAALIRLRHFDLDAYMLSSTVSGIVAQRLVRRLCLECRQLDSVLAAGQAEHLEREAIPRDYFQGRTVYRPRGCDACGGTGYAGRTGIFEVLTCDERIRDLVLSGASPQHLRRHVQDRIDHRTLLEDGLERVAAGVTSVEEVLRVAPHGAPPRPLSTLVLSPTPPRILEEV